MSNAYNPDGSKFGNLRGKVVVLTGGANGIGACTVRDLVSNGAKVVFGDYDAKAGEALTSSLGSDVTFLKMNVAEYSDNVNLFKLAREKHGRVDHAVAVAGIGERGDWFKSSLTTEDVEKPEQIGTVEVNLIAVLYFIRVALPYLRLERKEGEDKSVVIVGSAAGFRESPGLPIYNATKHGVQGVMRSLRKSLWESERIRINVLNPGVTDTNMANVVANAFRKAGLQDAVNMPEDLAVTILGFLTEADMWGKSVYVEGGKGWEWEQGYWDSMPSWLGEAPTQRLRDGLKLVASGKIWDFHYAQQAPK
ncbi:hypothetical protein, variant [Verruconis gallopava]|uniref:Uncharacterized protein n=1 Tax=Verruconis gallopava TaxID=253628 RepID=A0A0D2A7V8_9PEZI|nr:uncharacterized protein PV09_05903 [Verruconis gallopava]XP_016212717.1 hypothetical protein, variant [Verruconis gallopava]KIW02847.1 hypothetical protein PV09_05903 [Verruconis gallopava]KIW02848.1 hypothetical protein, variant [Verruconis gallopava]